MKSQIDGYEDKLGQLAEQVSFMARNKDSNREYLEEKIEKIKIEIKGVERTSIYFNEIIKSFDIIISKAYLIFEGYESLNFDKLKNELKVFENDFKNLKMELNYTLDYGEDINQTAMNNLKVSCKEFQKKFILEEKISQLLEIDSINSFKDTNKYNTQSGFINNSAKSFPLGEIS